jgi:hypothetical protein
MNNLTELYGKIKSFADDHNMVNEFFVANTEEDLNNREFNFKTLALLLLEANISRDLNSPIYTLDFGAIVIDKIGEDDDLESIMSSEENLFVIGQLQDYLIQEGYDVDFGEVELVSAMGEEYNITSAMSDFSVVLARKPYIRGIDS